jgi:hypothetical protein
MARGLAPHAEGAAASPACTAALLLIDGPIGSRLWCPAARCTPASGAVATRRAMPMADALSPASRCVCVSCLPGYCASGPAREPREHPGMRSRGRAAAGVAAASRQCQLDSQGGRAVLCVLQRGAATECGDGAAFGRRRLSEDTSFTERVCTQDGGAARTVVEEPQRCGTAAGAVCVRRVCAARPLVEQAPACSARPPLAVQAARLPGSWAGSVGRCPRAGRQGPVYAAGTRHTDITWSPSIRRAQPVGRFQHAATT